MDFTQPGNTSTHSRNSFFSSKPCLVIPVCWLGETISHFSTCLKTDSKVLQCNATNEYGYIFTNAFLYVLGKYATTHNYKV